MALQHVCLPVREGKPKVLNMISKILAPLDGSQLSESILPYVAQVARGLDIPILLTTILDSGGSSKEASSPADEKTIDRLRQVEGNLKATGVKVDFALSHGQPAEEILNVAAREECELIAMATHGRNSLGRGIFGGVTDKVMHSSDLPILAIAPESAREYWQHGVDLMRVVVPLDGSHLAETALPYAREIADGLSLTMVVVSVMRTTGHKTGLWGDASTGPSTEDEEVMDTYLSEIIGRLASGGLEVQKKILKGSPAKTIVDFAQERPNDMVILSTRGHSGFTRWALGSVAENVVRASGNPVLVIPPARSATTGEPVKPNMVDQTT